MTMLMKYNNYKNINMNIYVDTVTMMSKKNT